MISIEGFKSRTNRKVKFHGTLCCCGVIATSLFCPSRVTFLAENVIKNPAIEQYI